jgi:chloramphenicol-sensitive protein RarD
LSHETRLGLLYTTTAFIVWGFVPVYWKMLQHVAALEILAHRVVWGLAIVVVWMTLRKRWPEFRDIFGRPRTVAALLASTVFIAINWGLFVYAVNTDRVLATSLGYYINPLVNVLLGLVVLRERLNRKQWVAVALASLAVILLTVRAGELPWISLVLPVSFGLYSLLRKTVHADAVVGFTFETAALAPFAIALLLRQERLGIGALGHHGLANDALLAAAGAVTAVPLILFTLGVRRIPLSTAGFLQYIAPTCTFLLAVFVYHESFTTAHVVSFALIWIALAIYSFDLAARLRREPALESGESPAVPLLED